MFWQKWWFWVVILGFSLPIFGDQLKAIVSSRYEESEKVKKLRDEIVNLRHQLTQARAKIKVYEAQKEISQEDRERLRRKSSGQQITVIGFCDLVGFTDFITRVGDEKAKVLLDEYNKMVRSALKKHGGTEIKQLGDGFLFSLTSSQQAVKASLAIKNGIKEINSNKETSLYIRIGLHAGEVIKNRDDVIGSAVNMTERIMNQASGGQIVTSRTFRELIGTATDFSFIDLGEKKLKGFAKPKKLYSIDDER